MKTLWKMMPAMVSMAGPCVAEEERLIPVDQFLVTVETNDWLRRAENRDGLNVSASILRSGEGKAGYAKVEVSCVDFDSAERDFSPEDQEMFGKAAEAATRKEAFSKEILSPTLFAKKETLFEAKAIDGVWVVTVTRGGKTATFEPAEGDRLAKALVEARAGEKWFKELLHAKKRPEPTPVAHPPRSGSYMMSSQLGKVGGRGIDYSVTINNMFGEPDYSVQHWLSYRHGKDDSSWSSGVWSERVLKRVADALSAIRRGSKYSFKSSNEGNEGFTVIANLETKEAELTIPTNLSPPEPASKTGYFGVAQLETVQKLLDETQPRIQWFRENEELFFNGPDF